MLSETQEKSGKQIIPHNCPICGVQTNYAYVTIDPKENAEAVWFRCQCGIIFQDEMPKHGCYDERYTAAYAAMKEHDLRVSHAAYTIAPLIEELTYGRMMLDVGFNDPANMKFFEDRGWLTWGIDVNPSLTGKGNLYRGDFMTYDFQPQIKDAELKQLADEKKIVRKFDLIWMSHVFEHFNDPIATLHRAYDLLDGAGVLYISTPDIDFINKTGVSEFPHWKKDEHYIMWSEGALKREVERTGFKVIMSRRNFSSRYSSWYDIQMLAQKNYF
jgi:SAM-dependent methyltransferase